MVACTDETVWFIRKEIIQELCNKNIDFSKNKFGWGWDLVLSGICFLKGFPVIRDYNHTIEHPKGTVYDKDKASDEMRLLWQSLDSDMKDILGKIKGNQSTRNQLVNYFQ
jgi:hypothetical protein